MKKERFSSSRCITNKSVVNRGLYFSNCSLTCLAWKGFTETNKRRYTGQQPGTKSAFRPADLPRLHRRFCSSVGVNYVRTPGHALHEKGLQRQIGGGTLVSSHEQRALFVPRLNRGSTADFVPPSVSIGFRLFVLLERRSSDVSSIPWKVQGTCVSWANSSVGTQSCPTPPGRPAGRPDSTRP